MDRELLCTAGRRISGHCVVIVEGESEENYFVTLVELLVIIMC
jgi:hypothetical protein